MKGREYLYTRSYPRQEPKKESPSIDNTLNIAPPHRVLSESEIPKGYSGTAILRESDGEQTHTEKAEGFPKAPEVVSSAPQIRMRRLKTATKIPPSLLRAVADGSDADCESNERPCHSDTEDSVCSCDEPSDALHRCAEASPTSAPDRSETGGAHSCRDKRTYRCVKRRKPSATLGDDRHARRSPVGKLRDRSFSLEDLLLGGLILLLLNEGADDDIILMLGFLLFSAL